MLDGFKSDVESYKKYDPRPTPKKKAPEISAFAPATGDLRNAFSRSVNSDPNESSQDDTSFRFHSYRQSSVSEETTNDDFEDFLTTSATGGHSKNRASQLSTISSIISKPRRSDDEEDEVDRELQRQLEDLKTGSETSLVSGKIDDSFVTARTLSTHRRSLPTFNIEDVSEPSAEFHAPEYDSDTETEDNSSHHDILSLLNEQHSQAGQTSFHQHDQSYEQSFNQSYEQSFRQSYEQSFHGQDREQQSSQHEYEKQSSHEQGYEQESSHEQGYEKESSHEQGYKQRNLPEQEYEQGWGEPRYNEQQFEMPEDDDSPLSVRRTPSEQSQPAKYFFMSNPGTPILHDPDEGTLSNVGTPDTIMPLSPKNHRVEEELKHINFKYLAGQEDISSPEVPETPKSAMSQETLENSILLQNPAPREFEAFPKSVVGTNYPSFRTSKVAAKNSPGQGPCRVCGDSVVPTARGSQKAIYSRTGELSGQWHRGCFSCSYVGCSIKFSKNVTCYALLDNALCQQHYHLLNGTLCHTCNSGIEGECIENDTEQKWHPACLQCTRCHQGINTDYYIVSGEIMCHNDATKAIHTMERSGMATADKVEKRRTRMLFIDQLHGV